MGIMSSMITVRIRYDNEKVCYKSIFLIDNKPTVETLEWYIKDLKKQWRTTDVAITYIKEDILE
jgi:hypothetical protein